MQLVVLLTDNFVRGARANDRNSPAKKHCSDGFDCFQRIVQQICQHRHVLVVQKVIVAQTEFDLNNVGEVVVKVLVKTAIQVDFIALV